MSEYQGVKFTVQGLPVAKGRPRFAKRGNFVSTYTPKVTVNFENLVKLSFMQASGPDFKPIEGPVILIVKAMFPRPKSHFGSGKNADKLKDSAPEHMANGKDLDNILKAVSDALNKTAFVDDRQIVTISAHKCYTDRPRTEVEVYPV